MDSKHKNLKRRSKIIPWIFLKMTLVYSQVIKDNQKNSFTRLDPFGVGLNWFDLQILGAVGFEKSNQESLFWASSLYK